MIVQERAFARRRGVAEKKKVFHAETQRKQRAQRCCSAPQAFIAIQHSAISNVAIEGGFAPSTTPLRPHLPPRLRASARTIFFLAVGAAL